MNEASNAQVTAAAPDISTWLSANAGSGKTRVLTDRVARLLLAGVEPERILCLTYTKAAAMEMQNRLFERLGEWAMLEDMALRDALARVGETGLTPELLRRARTLFARAIEAPGGLKIQTIHSFCASVLRRFPLEAGVAPGFQEIDERAQRRLVADLLNMLADDPATAPALDAAAAMLSDDDGLMKLALGVAGKAGALSQPMEWEGIAAFFGLPPHLTDDRLIARVILGDEGDLAPALIPHLDLTKANQKKLAETLRQMPWTAMNLTALETLEKLCVTQSGATEGAPKAIANGDVRKAMGPDLVARYDALAARLADARPLRLGLLNARRTHALHRFAAVFLPAFSAAKQMRGWLDFDDLIRHTRDLLSVRSVAQWVLFRLDGGIDHILVDEAQDTSPEQWDIVSRLAEDFAAGQGARSDTRRTIFVVGDKKQSIYSFQGAEPRGFDRMRDHFQTRLGEIDAPFQVCDLLYSFRSADPILRLVDRVAETAETDGLGGLTDHRAFFGDKPGRVDLWPVVEKAETGKKPAWDDPQDLVGDDHHHVRLARMIADQIGAMIDAGAPVTHDGTARAVTPGDILILVRRRSGVLFRAIITALKDAGLPVAGVDRAMIAEPLAVKDLMSLMRFLVTPEDDLSLAELLRSPIGGWDEAALFGLAHGRDGYLWRALQSGRDRWPETVAMLEDLRNAADFLRPYDLLERVLVRHDARRRLIARLGPEAEDGIDALLAQSLAYERIEVPSLTGFIGWMAAGDVEVKRDLAKPTGEIRVMTVHGAKGLEAPVVILPDTGPRQPQHSSPRLVQPEGGPVVWAGAKETLPEALRPVIEAEADRAAEEADRLLYVAMTRAESWLIVAAAGEVSKVTTGTWYARVAAAMQDCGARPFDLPQQAGTGLRLESGDWSPQGTAAPEPTPPPVLPPWITDAAPPAKRAPSVLSPSDLGGAKALPGEAGDGDEAARLRRGRLVHLLLEHLPGFPEPAWSAAAPGICALEAADIGAAECAAVLDEATGVLTDPGLAPLFGPDSLAEVAITGDSAILGRPVHGVIDRLVVTGGTVTAIDIKTNRQLPATPEAVPEGLLRQMGAYAELLGAIYPDHRIGTAILWSVGPNLMQLPHDLVMSALARATPT